MSDILPGLLTVNTFPASKIPARHCNKPLLRDVTGTEANAALLLQTFFHARKLMPLCTIFLHLYLHPHTPAVPVHCGFG
jgi:hypothetical protein